MPSLTRHIACHWCHDPIFGFSFQSCLLYKTQTVVLEDSFRSLVSLLYTAGAITTNSLEQTAQDREIDRIELHTL